MRRTTLHRTTAATAAAAAAALLLAGCGTQQDGKGTGGPASATAPGSGGASPSTARPPAPGCTAHADLTAADSGRTLCLTVGGYLRLTLDGTKERPWTPVRATGTVLKGADAGIVILPGDALAAYTATAPGTARLTASRPLCATAPGRVSCQGIQEWTVTVKVTEP
ncbi:hypothetical protein [Streptomyces sp. NRRL S-340]|uniref:hypothetical protein n=1 Tax=Streptomyces sp. NRRL S-340 TaxID=1463901 RepID=UPI000567DA9F|nr:hypothetical protein [Streptomyces sp. NRRL S-340]